VTGWPSFHIRFGGATDFEYVADTAAAFIACADNTPEGARVFNLHGETVTIERIADFINASSRAGLITYGGPPIPIAAAMDDTAIRQLMPDLPSTPFEPACAKRWTASQRCAMQAGSTRAI
jgi:nucleoside-diphosphate-sugar epimerase